MIIFDYSQPGTLIHRLDPRLRVVMVCAFALLVLLCERPEALAAALSISLILTVIARVTAARIFRRLIELNLFMLILAAFLPLTTPGAAVFQVGPLGWSEEGLVKAALIALRANIIMIALGALLATMEPAHLGFALDRLGCPAKFTHVLLFMVRYIEVFHQEYHRLSHAMLLRGFSPGFDRHTFRSFGYLIGQLVVRSLDRSERVFEAMKCRGFRGRFYVLAPFRMRARDLKFAILFAGCIVLLSWMEWRWLSL